MRRLRLVTGMILLGALVAVGWARAQTEPPALPPPLSTDQVRLDDRLFSDFVQNRTVAIRLGKALFWDMQLGSDVQACASCHFHAGADNRARNQLSPSGAPAAAFADPPRTDFFPGYAPDDTLVPADFPRPKENDDVTSSHGVAHIQFLGLVPGPDGLMDDGQPAGDQVFSRDGVQLRRVEPRNSPTVINAIFNHRNFWDGRANFVFNGVSPFGNRDPNAHVLDNQSGSLTPRRIDLEFASLASQAVGPPESDFEMSFAGRRMREIGRKMLSITPLGMQLVHPNDSVLGGQSAHPARGLTTTYSAMIEAAFYSRWWSSSELTDGWTHKEYNFSMYFGIAVMLYEATLVSDDAPIDRFLAGDDSALTARQKSGLQVFLNEGKCINCHSGPEFSKAASHLFPERQEEGLVERMLMGDKSLGPAVYDNGFYNIGVRDTREDIGLGAEGPFGHPLSFTRQYVQMLKGQNVPDPFQVDPCTFEIRFQREDFPAGTVFREVSCGDGTTTVEPIGPPEVLDAIRVAVDGAFKVPTLRNIELTGPYFHNGGQATLRQVVDFYNRGGDFSDENRKDLDPDIEQLFLSVEQRDALVDFMIAMTDERVRLQYAPFDHPQLFLTNGHGDRQDRGDGVAIDEMLELPAVGKLGEQLDGTASDPLRPFLCLNPFAAVTPSTSESPCGAGPGQHGLLFFWNGEGCNRDTCDASTGYTIDPAEEFSAGDTTATFNSSAKVDAGAALFGQRGMASPSAFTYMSFDVLDQDILSSAKGTICTVVRNSGTPAAARRRLFLALAPSASSYIGLEFYGTDDLQLTYRDVDGVNTNRTTGNWNGADTTDTMLIQASYDSTASPGLRLLVDGVQRISSSAVVKPLGEINLLRIGNASSKAGSFDYDQFLISDRSDVDCWDMLAGTCDEDGARCMDDADCGGAQTCVGVREGFDGAPPVVDDPDPTDECPSDPDKLLPGICGCGVADDDSDGDGTPDCNDACPGDANKTEPGDCGCGTPDRDRDDDGIVDCNDDCLDVDGDGYGAGSGCLGTDCDDTDASTTECGAGDPGVLLYFNGEGCTQASCSASTGYTFHPTREFSAGDNTATFNSDAVIGGSGALFGDYGLSTPNSFDYMNLAVSNQDVMSSTAGTICTVVKNAGTPAAHGRRLLLAQARSSTSFITIEFSGADDLRVHYRDKNEVNLRPSTGSWNGAGGTDAMLIQVSYDSTAANGLRLAVDGVERMSLGAPVEPLGPIDRIKVGNASKVAGAFDYDQLLISNRPDLDCWDLLAGTCSTRGDRCLEDTDCPGSETCEGVTSDFDQLP